MTLDGLRISSSAGAIIRIREGALSAVFRDRRSPDSQTDVRTGAHARRRKLPSRLLHLVGSGRLWVARGWVRIDAREAAAYPKATEMVVRIGDLSVQIAHLKPSSDTHDGNGLLEWTFHALFLPTARQIEHLTELGLVADDAAGDREALESVYNDEPVSFRTMPKRFVFKVE